MLGRQPAEGVVVARTVRGRRRGRRLLCQHERVVLHDEITDTGLVQPGEESGLNGARADGAGREPGLFFIGGDGPARIPRGAGPVGPDRRGDRRAVAVQA